MKKNLVLLLTLLTTYGLSFAQIPQTQLQKTSLLIGVHQIDAQLAQTPNERELGLMFRKEMPAKEGMLFIFEKPNIQCFWMKNTPLPLTAAFLADNGTIVNLADMQPHTTEPHCSSKPVRYVLEMNQGWFSKKGIKAGAKLKGEIFESAKKKTP